jgi:hypothetical protein
VRIGAFLLFVAATALLSLLDGPATNVAAFVLCTAGAGLITSRHLGELAAHEEPEVRIRVVRWNY